MHNKILKIFISILGLRYWIISEIEPNPQSPIPIPIPIPNFNPNSKINYTKIMVLFKIYLT